MAWTTPVTYTQRQNVTAADLNADVRDDLSYLHSGTSASGFFFSRSSASIGAGAVQYYGPWESATETDVSIPIPCAGTIKRLYVIATAAPGAGETFIYVVRKNAADTSLTCTVSGASATTAQDLGNSVTVAAMDLISVKLTVSGGGASAYHRICWQLTN